jgi:hypothetical protein
VETLPKLPTFLFPYQVCVYGKESVFSCLPTILSPRVFIFLRGMWGGYNFTFLSVIELQTIILESGESGESVSVWSEAIEELDHHVLIPDDVHGAAHFGTCNAHGC